MEGLSRNQAAHGEIHAVIELGVHIFQGDLQQHKGAGAVRAGAALLRVNILYQEILYVHKDRRNVEIVTADQEPVTDSRGIKELFQELADPRFLFIDRSCFVNLDRVQGLEGSLLVLANGEKLPISRPMLPKVKEAIISLWGKGR